MTRKEMEEVIGRGQSVTWRGRLISRVEDLPKASELTEDDPAAAQEELQRLQARQADLEKQIADLKAAQERPQGQESGEKPEDGEETQGEESGGVLGAFRRGPGRPRKEG
jgi:hypothetical protein